MYELSRRPESSSPSEFERTPPQDLMAEQSVLGGMLLNRDAIADVIEVLKSQDFYRPAHAMVFDTILDLYGRGEPADAVTVGDALTRNGEAGRVGGLPYLHTLVQTVPTAANAGYYAKIVAELAILRRLVEAGTRIVQLGYSADGQEVDDIVDRAQQTIYDVTERRTSEDYELLEALMQPTMDELEAIGGRNGMMSGVPTGFLDLDNLTNGLHPGQLIVIAGRPGLGKALALDTPLPTPTGWTTMGAVQVGDQLIGADGKPTTVVAATEVMVDRPCYEVTFSDGTTIVADQQHQWVVGRSARPVITAELMVGDVVPNPENLDLWASHADVEVAAVRSVARVVAIDSVPVRCVEVDNDEHLYLASYGYVPTHNSTMGLDIARSASIKHSQPSVIFSLEMSKTEITMRLLSAEARVPLHHMRSGSMTDDDWSRLARRMGEVAEAPLFIDDSPNLTMMEIRSKARRLKQRNQLRLVVIDYLQLMNGNKKAESRQQEVSEISRALKLLAKELEVPVIAMSQLNRGAEQRTDKKPMLSDLRESGCLPASTRILRADTGAETTIGELFTTGATDVPVWSLDDSLRYVRRHLTHVFSTGVKPVLRLQLASGKTVRATANHPFLTYDGWRALGDLQPGARLAVPRHVPAPELESSWSDEQVIMLAHLLGDGSFVKGLFGARSHEKLVPAEVFHLPKRQIRLFLRHIWATDGSVTLNKGGHGGRVYYASTSRRLIDELALLLLRFGISARIRSVPSKGSYRRGWTLDISDADDQKRFLGEIGVHGARAANVQLLLDAISAKKPNTNVDTVPTEVWQKVRRVLAEQGMTHREFAAAVETSFGGSTMWKRAPSRERLSRVAAVLHDKDLEMDATNDVFWDAVVSIEPDGVEEVFDATVVGTHNFVADGIAVHNSIEQDADMVILLHREDAYEKESPRAGEADFIVAKHRNGPTATITVAFQGHYSRFVDMSSS